MAILFVIYADYKGKIKDDEVSNFEWTGNVYCALNYYVIFLVLCNCEVIANGED